MIAAAVNWSRMPDMKASSIVSCAIAIRSAKSRAAPSRGDRSVASDSFAKSVSYSPGSPAEGARLSCQRRQAFSSAIRSRTSSFSAKGKRPLNLAGK